VARKKRSSLARFLSSPGSSAERGGPAGHVNAELEEQGDGGAGDQGHDQNNHPLEEAVGKLGEDENYGEGDRN
jgi:hypothetical protein